MQVNDEIEKEYLELNSPPDNADAIWFRRRGFAFEKILVKLLEADNLEPRSGYKPEGEQIDGSFFLDGSVYLLEAKWHKDEIPASTLYQFKGKIDGKLTGTIGVFISMSGYSKDAVDALTLGKTLNIILFDKRDIDAAINKNLGFRSILKSKLRRAAEEGVVYFPSEIDVVTKNGVSSITISQESIRTLSNLIIVCEGVTDEKIISILVNRILTKEKSLREIKIVAARGKLSIPNMVNSLVRYNEKILIVVDSDNEEEKTLEMLKKNISSDIDWFSSIPEPAIESWIGIDIQELRHKPYKERIKLSTLANEIDLDELRKSDKSFSIFYDAIIAE